MDAQQPQQGAPAAGKPGPIDHADLADWTNRFNAVLADTSQITAPGPADARPWTTNFFGCLMPIDICCMTYCLPCVQFGKIHHRTRKNGNMEGYEPVNTSCLLFCASMWVGLHWIPQSLQRSDIRKKYGLEGSCLTDIALSCCCALCSLVQEEKETTMIEEQKLKGVGEQYHQNGETMSYAPKA